ncbi:OGA GlcNAcase, partial [Cercotrichas coryphoeus]|nr:OGA GlcNAcase [Cercotrichas coryphoeus]
PLTLEEVRMLVELFYLPYQHGALAQELLEHFRWLRANSLSVGVPPAAPDAGGVRLRSSLQGTFPPSWAAQLVPGAVTAGICVAEAELPLPSRILFLMCVCVLLPPGCQSITAPILLGRDAEPWARRGGLFGELQALLPVGNSCDLFYHPPPLFPSSQLYLLRPLLPLDKGSQRDGCWMYEEGGCSEVSQGLQSQLCHAPAPPGRLLGSFLSLSPEYTFVLEDEGGPCGYAAGALHAEGFLQQRDSSWLPAIRHKYPPDLGTGGPALGQEAVLFFHTEPLAVPQPVLRRFPSLVQLGTAPRVLDVGASRSLALCLLSALRANGSRGVFCQVSDADRQQLSFYSKLG